MFLARRLKPASVKQYLNIIRILHLEFGYVNPIRDSWLVKSTLLGISRELGVGVIRKLPIHPELLVRMKSYLNLKLPCDIVFWAVCLVLFFGMFRKSNILPSTIKDFDAKKQFVRSDFKWNSKGHIELNVSWSKIIQFKERTFVVKLPAIHPHPLCPVKAMLHYFAECPVQTDSPCFINPSKSGVVPLTCSVFVSKLKKVLSLCGVDPKRVGTHSFRRGSATWALCCGIPGEVVKILRDWKSTAYLSYLDQIPDTILHFYQDIFHRRLPQ